MGVSCWDWLRLSKASKWARSNTRPVLNHITTYSMDLCGSTTSRLESTRIIDQATISGPFQSSERIGQGIIGGESQRQRYASFFCYAYWLVSKHGPWATVYQSTSSMTTLF